MMFSTILKAVQYQQKIQRSTFHCFLFPISDISEARSLLSQHAKEYANATHNCFAYILGTQRETQYYSDAGEPHGTAGKPMLNSLLRNNLTNVLAIVTRHYGGVKLGVKGLIEAYGETVEQTITLAQTIVSLQYFKYSIDLDYSIAELVSGKVKALGGDVCVSEWTDRVHLLIRIPQEQLIEFVEILDGLRQQNSLHYEEVR